MTMLSRSDTTASVLGVSFVRSRSRWGGFSMAAMLRSPRQDALQLTGGSGRFYPACSPPRWRCRAPVPCGCDDGGCRPGRCRPGRGGSSGGRPRTSSPGTGAVTLSFLQQDRDDSQEPVDLHKATSVQGSPADSISRPACSAVTFFCRSFTENTTKIRPPGVWKFPPRAAVKIKQVTKKQLGGDRMYFIGLIVYLALLIGTAFLVGSPVSFIDLLSIVVILGALASQCSWPPAFCRICSGALRA